MRSYIAAAAAAVTIAMLTPPAGATLTLQSGLVGGSGDVDNVIFATCGTSAGPSTFIQGCLNTSHTTLVDFTGKEQLIVPSGGQARIAAQDGSFDAITINLDDTSTGFSKLQFNLDANADGFANFTAIDQFGNLFTFNNVALNGNGNNFFTLGSNDGQVALSFSLTSTVALSLISDLEQVRIGPADLTPPTDAPEPFSIALLGTALLGLGFVRKRQA